ncbi:MAG TPA: hypothetical protein VHS28_05785 [Chloroflexota bacterium]|nr:hypothetical protein [Chloroflexota bacterium]
MFNRRDQWFGIGLGVGVVLGFLLGTAFASLISEDAAEAMRSVAGRVRRRRDGIHFEALLQ